jgi:histidyl-tRNA synthetase
MRDLLPVEVLQRRHLLERILPVYEKYGYQQIETPALEELDRLMGSEGGDNDKLIYKVMKRGISDWPPASESDAADLGLRYDLTVPLARFYATHSNELLVPFRAIQVGPVWRAERPQKGRYRQFMQCDIDVLGETSADAEIELLAGGAEALTAAGLSEFTIRLNDRRLLRAIAAWAGFDNEQEACVLIALDKLDKVGAAGVADELSQLGNEKAASKLADLVPMLEETRGLDAMLSALPVTDDQVLGDLEFIVKGVTVSSHMEVDIEIDPTLVRGQGYYTGAIFEVEHASSGGSLAGGGRYDNMIKKLSGVDVPATGFSIGFERIWDLLSGTLSGDGERVVLLHDATDTATVQRTSADLRNRYVAVRTERAGRNRSAQLTRLKNNGFTHWFELTNSELSDINVIEENE